MLEQEVLSHHGELRKGGFNTFFSMSNKNTVYFVTHHVKHELYAHTYITETKFHKVVLTVLNTF